MTVPDRACSRLETQPNSRMMPWRYASGSGSWSLPLASGLGNLRFEVSDPQQVKRRQGEDEHPPHPRCAPMPRFPQRSHGLHPTEDLFNEFALPLTDLVPLVASGAPTNRAPPFTFVWTHRRPPPPPPPPRHEALCVEALVPSHGEPPSVPPFRRPDHRLRRLALRRPRRLGQASIHHQAVPG